MPRRTWRISAFIEKTIGEQVYELAQARGGSVTGILEAALSEYLAARPKGTLLPLAASLPNPPGRPSQITLAAGAAREERVRKRTGRPLGSGSRNAVRSAMADDRAADGQQHDAA